MDADFALALSLQLENDEANCMVNEARSSSGPSRPSRPITSSGNGSLPLSIVDESWELFDPVPNIHDLFLQFNDAYFDGKLAGIEVRWSPRMTLCAGLCCYEGRGGLCSIRLSQPLLKLRPRRDLVQTLLHEMIHAVLFVTQNNKDHDSHGPEFHKHMYRINKQTGSNITVYHNFHDEVNNYRQHWWKCDGPCQSRPPFYGIVRRAMNRAPSKNDTWWADHMKSCSGKFVKIKEPDDYGKKGSKRKRDDSAKDGSKNCVKNGGEMSSNGKTKQENSGNDIAKWFFKRANDGKDSSSSKTVIRTINDSTSGESSKAKPISFFSGTGQSLGSGSSDRSVNKDSWLKPTKTAKGAGSNKTVVRTINDSPTGEASNDTPRSFFSGTGQSLGSGSSDRSVNKDQWFKPNKALNDTNATKPVIRTIKDDPSDEPGREEPSSFFSGSGKSLGSRRSDGSLKRDQWIKQLMEKQRNTQKKFDSIAKIPSHIKSEQEKDRNGGNRFSWNHANDDKTESDLGHDRANKSSKKSVFNSTDNDVDVRMRRLDNKYKSGTSTVSSANKIPMDGSSNESNSFSATNELSNSADESLQFNDSMTERTSISIEMEPPLIERIARRRTDDISCSNNPASDESFRIMSRTTEHTPSSKQADQAHDTLQQNAANDSLIVISESRKPIEVPEELVDCPVCPEKVPINSINLHLDRCLSRCS